MKDIEPYDFNQDSYCLSYKNFNYVYFEDKYKSFFSTINQMIDLFNANDCFIENITILNIPTIGSPVNHSSANLILTFAFSEQQLIYQLSHELTHLYLKKTMINNFKFVEELLASAISLNILELFKINLNIYLKEKKFIKDLVNFQNFLNEYEKYFMTIPTIVYNNQKNFLPSYFLKDLNLFEILNDLKLLPKTNLNDFKLFLILLKKVARSESTFKFVNFINYKSYDL